MRPLNLVWRRSILDGVLEASFLRQVVFGALTRPLRWIAVEDSAPLPDLDDVLVCSFADPSDYLRQLRSAGRRNIGVLHLGDERAEDDLAFYAEADYVLRHYHRPGLPPTGGLCQTIQWLPNGWARGVGPVSPNSRLPFEARRHELFFAGYAGKGTDGPPARRAMLDALSALGRPATVIVTDGFGQGLGPASYAAYLGDTQLALAPAGNAPETLRFYDALECGALAVVTDNAWLHAPDGAAAVGEPPVVIIDDWRALAGLRADAFDEDRRQAAIAWWARLKDHAAARCAEIVETAFMKTAQ